MTEAYVFVTVGLADDHEGSGRISLWPTEADCNEAVSRQLDAVVVAF